LRRPFRHLGRSSAGAAARHHHGQLPPRQVIYLPGDRAQGIHFLAQGRIKISKVTRDGKELTLAYRTEGDFFGEPCLLDGGPREEMAEAMDSSTPSRSRASLLDNLLKTTAAPPTSSRAR
jgi:CRP-like cAMP-binding protein